jgi:hypothetical protein
MPATGRASLSSQWQGRLSGIQWPCSSGLTAVSPTGTTYTTLAAALSTALAGTEIRAHESQFDSAFTLDKGLAHKGGYDGTFLAKGSSPTTLIGSLTVTSGASTADTVVVKGSLAVQGGSLLVNGVTVRQ